MIFKLLRLESLPCLDPDCSFFGEATGGGSSDSDKGGRGWCCHIPFAGLLSLACDTSLLLDCIRAAGVGEDAEP